MKKPTISPLALASTNAMATVLETARDALGESFERSGRIARLAGLTQMPDEDARALAGACSLAPGPVRW